MVLVVAISRVKVHRWYSCIRWLTDELGGQMNSLFVDEYNTAS